MWDDWDFGDLFGGGDLDFSELPMMEAPLFEEGLSMGPDFQMPEWMSELDFGDNIDQGGGWNPGSGAGGLSNLFSGGKGGGLGGLSNLFNGGGGGFDLTSLLAMLGMGAGAWNANNASKDSAEEIKNASKEANQIGKDLIAPAQANFQPYIDTGQNALADLYAMTQKPGLASKFGPLTAKSMPKIKGSISLAELAKR